MKRLLVPLVKLALAEDSASAPVWRRELDEAHRALSGSPVDLRADLDKVWPPAITEAERDPAVRRDETVNPTLPLACPIEATSLATASPDWDRLIAAIRDNASFG